MCSKNFFNVSRKLDVFQKSFKPTRKFHTLLHNMFLKKVRIRKVLRNMLLGNLITGQSLYSLVKKAGRVLKNIILPGSRAVF